MNLIFSLNNNQTCTVAAEKKEDFSLFLTQVARAQEEQTVNITDLILVVPELGTFYIPSENQPTLLQWLNENATISLFESEVLRPLYKTSLDFNTNTFQ